jgi:hypothetical protein
MDKQIFSNFKADTGVEYPTSKAYIEWLEDEIKKRSEHAGNYSIAEMKSAFDAGSFVAGFSDMGVTMQYDTFEQWFNEKYV